MTVKKSSRMAVTLVAAILVMTASAVAFYKIIYLGYNLNAVVQAESFYLETVVEFYGHGTPIDIDLALPLNLSSQTVRDESFQNGDLRFEIHENPDERRGSWTSKGLHGNRRLSYTATVLTKNQKFLIDSTIMTEQPIPREAARELLPDTAIQCDNPEIAALADSLGIHRDSTMLYNVRKIFHYVTKELKYVQYSGTTDALTAYHIGEASCGGKSRLMAALARHLGIPARLVGGKILASGQSTATHIWIELFINGYWVPFCPTNNYFAELPSEYLILYYDEKPLITHTKDINFKYFFNLKKRLVSTEEGLLNLKKNPLDALNIWASFKNLSISLELLRIIIMLPIGVLAVVFCRNIIGIETFGTFMPALVAIGFRETGLINGIILFGLIIAFGAIIRVLLSRLQLLHTPRLAIILSAVVVFMLFLTTIGASLGFLQLARVALFPMVIMTLTVERFSLISEESGISKALLLSIWTLVVTALAYLLMSWRFLQAVVISFPESILLVIALYIYVGRYSGFRLMEFFRFRHLLRRV